MLHDQNVQQLLQNYYDPQNRPRPNIPANAIITRGGDVYEVPREGFFRLDPSGRYYNQDFNSVFNIYSRFPQEKILNDYDDLVGAIRIASRSGGAFHSSMTTNGLCILKLAAESDNILSPESKRLLGCFGNNLPLPDMANKPGYLSHVDRKAIADELARNKDHMIIILNNRRL